MPVALSCTSETFSLRVDWCSGVLPHRMVVLLSQYSTRRRPSFSTAGSYRGLPLSSVGTETAELAAPGTPVAGGSRAQPQPKVRARAAQTAPQPIRKTTRFIKNTPLQKTGRKIFPFTQNTKQPHFSLQSLQKNAAKNGYNCITAAPGQGTLRLPSAPAAAERPAKRAVR